MRNEKYPPGYYPNCNAPAPAPKKSPTVLILFLSIILALLILAGIFGMIWLTQNTEEDTPEETSAQTAKKSELDTSAFRTETYRYVAQWPAGFPTDSELYRTYSGQPADGGDANTLKHVGYIYWHWCRGDFYDGPINRTTRLVRDGSHNSFHAYFSTVAPDVSGDYIYDDYDHRWVINPTPDGTYHHPDSCCVDTYWFYVIDVWEQDFVVVEQ